MSAFGWPPVWIMPLWVIIGTQELARTTGKHALVHAICGALWLMAAAAVWWRARIVR